MLSRIPIRAVSRLPYLANVAVIDNVTEIGTARIKPLAAIVAASFYIAHGCAKNFSTVFAMSAAASMCRRANAQKPQNARMDKTPSQMEWLREIPDPRIDRQKRHELLDIIMIAICQVVGGAEAWTEVEDYGKWKEELSCAFFFAHVERHPVS